MVSIFVDACESYRREEVTRVNSFDHRKEFPPVNWSPSSPHSADEHRPLDYAEIFDVRGRAYHEAMRRWPLARAGEFSRAVEFADVRPGQCVCDYPSGGGYLGAFIPVPVQLLLLEKSRTFLECAGDAPAHQRLLVENGVIPLPSDSVDRVISVAGLHHVADKTRVFREIRRCLKPGGRLVIADAAEGSPVGRFLNEFVDAHSDEGHAGILLNAGTLLELQACDCHVTFSDRVAYPWRFPTREAMIEYCQLLFGITKASPQAIHDGLESYLGFAQRDGQWELNWELMFVVAEAPER